ncbi:MAG: hypothetical protein AB8G23_14520 [Myxococcota bacterium]
MTVFAFPLLIAPLLIAMTALLSGCASSGPVHEHTLTPGRGFSPAIKTAAIVPLNLTVEVPQGADVANSTLYEYLSEYVDSKGLRPESVNATSFRAAIDIATNKARAEMMNTTSGKTSATLDFSMLVPHILRELESEADVLIVPNTVIRTGEYNGGKMLRWDGVKRRERSALDSIRGSSPAASIHTMIFDRQGEMLFSGFGGLDLLFRTDLQKRKNVLIEDRLQDEGNLRQGICIALYPFFGPEERCYY